MVRDILTEASDAVYATALKRIEDARALVAEDAQKISVATIKAVIKEFQDARGSAFPSEDEIQQMFSGYGIEYLTKGDQEQVFQMIALLLSDALLELEGVHPVGGL